MNEPTVTVRPPPNDWRKHTFYTVAAAHENQPAESRKPRLLFVREVSSLKSAPTVSALAQNTGVLICRPRSQGPYLAPRQGQQTSNDWEPCIPPTAPLMGIRCSSLSSEEDSKQSGQPHRERSTPNQQRTESGQKWWQLKQKRMSQTWKGRHFHL